MPDASPQILSVDDDKSIRALIRAKLENNGYQFHSASTGEAAIELLKTVDLDLVLLDIVMPVMTGLSLFQVMKELAPEVGVIFVTSINDMDLALDCVKNGALDYIVKSKIRYRLAPAVKQALERRTAMLDKDRRLCELENLLSAQAEVIEHKSREISALNQLVHGPLKSPRSGESLVDGEVLDPNRTVQPPTGSHDDALS